MAGSMALDLPHSQTKLDDPVHTWVMVGDVSDQRPNTPRGDGRGVDVDMYMALSENPLVYHALSSIPHWNCHFGGLPHIYPQTNVPFV